MLREEEGLSNERSWEKEMTSELFSACLAPPNLSGGPRSLALIKMFGEGGIAPPLRPAGCCVDKGLRSAPSYRGLSLSAVFFYLSQGRGSGQGKFFGG